MSSMTDPSQIKESFQWQNEPQDLTAIRIHSQRLELRPITLNHLDDVYENFTATITRYMLPSPPTSKAEPKKFIEESVAAHKRGDELVCAIILKEKEEFLGCVGLHVRGDSLHPELGVWVKESAHGNGYGREAVTALKKWADAHLFYEYATYPVDKKNIPSRKIPESLGGVIFRETVHKISTDKILDEVIYKIDRM